jgi:pyridinium-3,5-biscarboxylic acid mononucleotide synthase
MTSSDRLQSLLNAVAAGSLSPESARSQLNDFAYEAIDDFAKLDHHRSLRTGLPEVVWGQDKTAAQIAQIMAAMAVQQPIVLATRVTAEVFAEVQAQLPEVRYYPKAQLCAIGQAAPQPGRISLLTAGTSDLPVAEEAALTAELSGFQVERLWDVGVAGIHRLLRNREVIDRADVLIVVAGMEGALPSVVAGLAACPVIAVPTSIGYGANFGGLSALLTMLNSCAPGIGVVNIDNGFGAAMLAMQMLRSALRLSQQMTRPDAGPDSGSPPG